MTTPLPDMPSELLRSYTRSLVDLLDRLSLADRERLVPLLVQHLVGDEAVGVDAVAGPQSQPEAIGDGMGEV